MGCGRGIFEHGYVGEVLLGETFVFTQPTDAEITEAEAFALWYIDCGIDIEQIGRAAMCLIARDAAVAMRPICPLGGEVFEKEFTESLPIIADNTTFGIGTEGIFLI